MDLTLEITGANRAADHLVTFISDRFLIDGTDRPTIYKILDALLGDRLPTDSTDWPTVDKTLVALLAGGIIREEWAARYHNPVDGDVDTWRDTRGEAEATLAARAKGGWSGRSSLIRRFVIVTAPEVTP